jgi:hypothetical protein
MDAVVEELLKECTEAARRRSGECCVQVERMEAHSVTGSFVVEQGRERLVALVNTIVVAGCTQRLLHDAEESVDARLDQNQ